MLARRKKTRVRHRTAPQRNATPRNHVIEIILPTTLVHGKSVRTLRGCLSASKQRTRVN